MSGTCKDCKWWEFVTEDDGGCDGYGDCTNFVFLHGSPDSEYENKPSGLLIHTKYDTGAMTGPDFGCIHFEQKQDT